MLRAVAVIVPPDAGILPVTLRDAATIAPACDIEAFAPDEVPTAKPPDPFAVRLEQVIAPELATEHTVADDAFNIVNGLAPLSVIFAQLTFPHDRYPELSMYVTKLPRWLFIAKGTVYRLALSL